MRRVKDEPARDDSRVGSDLCLSKQGPNVLENHADSSWIAGEWRVQYPLVPKLQIVVACSVVDLQTSEMILVGAREPNGLGGEQLK